MLLSREWSTKLQGYFATNQSHLWLPNKGRNNQISVDSKRYMKHTITPLNGQNETMDFGELIFDNYFLETQLGCYLVQPSPIPPDTQLEFVPNPNSENDICKVSISNKKTNVIPSPYTYDMWTLYINGSKTRQQYGVGYVLIDPLQRKHLIASHLEFECTNNTTKYEALILSLQRAIDLNVSILKAVGDS